MKNNINLFPIMINIKKILNHLINEIINCKTLLYKIIINYHIEIKI